MKFNWKPKNTTGKPDFLTVILRRRGNLNDFLNRSNVKTNKELIELFNGLENEYTISEKMIEECLLFLESKEEKKLETIEEVSEVTEKPRKRKKTNDVSSS